ncbi:MAG: hypothetical protein JWL70_2732, partial [Acidimicrobiia bacterium]|nr:hypothetical protein [Acidimicrobiia bacterium]
MATIVIHGHFYQPPRENPWTELVPVEPSATPFHDWNERIAAECYRPNAFARIVDENNQVVVIVNNFDRFSFNIGPTLASWLERVHPAVHERIVEADRRSGSAMAQAYNHAILPLCNDEDLSTQIRWGLADFRHRFGRDAEGMWLPEAAVDQRVMEALAAEGVQFVILDAAQADRAVDVTLIHTWTAISGRTVSVLFYDGAWSNELAFGMRNQPASKLVDRAEQVAAGGVGPLALAATDGETFGHHHEFTERAIAYALNVEAPRRGHEVGSLARLLATDTAPRPAVGVRVSSWSCPHGVDRWRSNCGCGADRDWTQDWRAPLRDALDLLRDLAASSFEALRGVHLIDPWAARNEYIHVVLGEWTQDQFARQHLAPGGDLVLALTHLEAQRHAMCMFTSCGWFFEDLARIETIQVLRYAARCIDLLAEAGVQVPVDAFFDRLALARSNDPDEGTGLQVWERHVMASRVDARRVVAHVALIKLLRGGTPSGAVGGFALTVERHARAEERGLRLDTGRLSLRHSRTGRRLVYSYAVVCSNVFQGLGALLPAEVFESDDAGAVE